MQSEWVRLVGLDFGSTTASAVIARARAVRGAIAGRMELTDVEESYRSDMVFTPLRDEDTLDEALASRLLDDWLGAGGVAPGEIFGGGALLTGLTARRDNAAALMALVRHRLGDSLVVTADDPCLESWLAFHGSCAGLSRALPERHLINLDIGGGTTNLALGRGGEVLRTGCLLVGARHVRVHPGSYQIVHLSEPAHALLTALGIRKGPGDALEPVEVDAVLDFYLGLLEAALQGDTRPFHHPLGHLHQQVPFTLPREGIDPLVTLSGGVGELVYAALGGKPWPPTTAFGDLGIDLAQRLVASPRWVVRLAAVRPAAGGRATVLGLLWHGTEVSGTTLFLPNPEILPLEDVPILGSLRAGMADTEVRELLALARRGGQGGCLHVALESSSASTVRLLGDTIAYHLRESAFPGDRPLILLLRENLGQALGQHITGWGARPCALVVIDEVPLRDARFVRIGKRHGQVVPVSFHGLVERGGVSWCR